MNNFPFHWYLDVTKVRTCHPVRKMKHSQGIHAERNYIVIVGIGVLGCLTARGGTRNYLCKAWQKLRGMWPSTRRHCHLCDINRLGFHMGSLMLMDGRIFTFLLLALLLLQVARKTWKRDQLILLQSWLHYREIYSEANVSWLVALPLTFRWTAAAGIHPNFFNEFSLRGSSKWRCYGEILRD